MHEYLTLFIDKEYPKFIDKYLNTKTLERIKYVGQFCGCDYTALYRPLFFYSRFAHSLIVAHMTWHFTHDKKSTIAALLHDVGTPCFSHCIDYVLGDATTQESSEKDIVVLIKQDKELVTYLKEDGMCPNDLSDLAKYPILENKSPKLCTDRLDGVLHTCGIWLHTHSFEEIKKVYDNLVVMKNEDGNLEIGFQSLSICESFVDMVMLYAKELQGNVNKYTMQYVAEAVKKAIHNHYFSFEDLYVKKESEIVDILRKNIVSWKIFNKTDAIVRSDVPVKNFCVSVEAKKRNVIPLVLVNGKSVRINEVSESAKKKYDDFFTFKDTKYAFVKEIKEV